MQEWVLFLIGQAFTAGAVYGAIKGDIKALVQSAEASAKSAHEAHQRINDILIRARQHE